jgi:4'-phosphopantetheinyl transferase
MRYISPSIVLPLEEMCLKNLPSSQQYCIIAPRSLAKRLNHQILDQSERERLYRFRAKEDFDRYLTAHNLIRIIWGQLLGRNASDISFVNSIDNKPLLPDGSGQFNLSHSGDWVAIIVSLRTPVGIDIEQPLPGKAQIPSDLYAHPNDRFHPAAADTGVSRFFTAWTLKEAIAKCDGAGLGMPFSDIRLEPDGDNAYRGFYDCRTWYADHWILDDGTHLAYAGEVPCSPLHVLVT